MGKGYHFPGPSLPPILNMRIWKVQVYSFYYFTLFPSFKTPTSRSMLFHIAYLLNSNVGSSMTLNVFVYIQR